MSLVAGAVLDALADPTRRAVFELVAQQPSSVSGIALRLPVSRPAVSQHLRVLREAQLVGVTVRGRQHIYALDSRGLTAGRAYFEQFWTGALAAFARAADAAAEQESQT
jgi:DNA-binding transcriptional ArsR family regulator